MIIKTELINKLTQFKVKQNHNKKWGVLVGISSATFEFVHEDKEECLKYIRDNYETYFKTKTNE